MASKGSPALTKFISLVSKLESDLESVKKLGIEISTLDQHQLASASSVTLPQNSTHVQKLPSPEWLETLKRKLNPGGWQQSPLVVLSLFDGLGATWQALHDLGIPFIGYSSEIDEFAIQVVRRNWPSVIHLGDVNGLQRSHVPLPHVDLVIGGFPCQDLSCMNSSRTGLHGPQSKLFFQLLRILQEFKPTWFVVENVRSMAWLDREEITKYLGVLPLEMDSADLSAQTRKRYFWTNLELPQALPAVRDHASCALQHVVGSSGVALVCKTNCIIRSCYGAAPKQSLAKSVICAKSLKPRDLTITEVEKLFGLPPNYTLVAGENGGPKEGRKCRKRQKIVGKEEEERREGKLGEESSNEAQVLQECLQKQGENEFAVIELSDSEEEEEEDLEGFNEEEESGRSRRKISADPSSELLVRRNETEEVKEAEVPEEEAEVEALLSFDGAAEADQEGTPEIEAEKCMESPSTSRKSTDLSGEEIRQKGLTEVERTKCDGGGGRRRERYSLRRRKPTNYKEAHFGNSKTRCRIAK